jgi:hypothetical protein
MYVVRFIPESCLIILWLAILSGIRYYYNLYILVLLSMMLALLSLLCTGAENSYLTAMCSGNPVDLHSCSSNID